MADQETARALPAVPFQGVVLDQLDRMRDSGIPEKVDKRYMSGMADTTQFQYRQGLRHLGLITSDDQPTPQLIELVAANEDDRRELLGKIMSTRYPELTGLSLGASRDDFHAVLHGYGVTSATQQRKMLTFFVAAADYAGLQISPHIRPHKPLGRPQIDTSASQPSKTAIRAPEVRDISLGDAGSVSVIVNVDRWWELSDDQFSKLRKLIKEIEALGDSGS
jgi:hypothetical protein